MMTSIICMLLAVNGASASAGGHDAPILMCIKRAESLSACLIGYHLPLGGYFFEMEATALL
jgi:hypothetical protein